MKIICSKPDFSRAMTIVMRAVNRTTMPITEYVLIEASDSEITMTGNDMENAAKTYVNGTVKEPGAIAIDARIFNEIIHKLTDRNITVETLDNFNIKISAGRSKFNISGKDPDTFSSFPVVNSDKTISIQQNALKEAIQKTFFAVSTSDTNKQMTGELFEIKGDGELRITALDGHRVAIRDTEVNGSHEMKIIIPGKSLSELSKILSDSESEVKICHDINNVIFDVGDFRFSSRLIFGDYFKVDQLLNPTCNTEVMVSKDEFISSLNRATIIQRDGDKKPVVFNIHDDVMEISAQSAIGATDEDLEIKKTGDDIKIGFNPKLLLEALSAVPDDEIKMELSNSKSPCYIRNADYGYTYIVLPVNI